MFKPPILREVMPPDDLLLLTIRVGLPLDPLFPAVSNRSWTRETNGEPYMPDKRWRLGQKREASARENMMHRMAATKCVNSSTTKHHQCSECYPGGRTEKVGVALTRARCFPALLRPPASCVAAPNNNRTGSVGHILPFLVVLL